MDQLACDASRVRAVLLGPGALLAAGIVLPTTADPRPRSAFGRIAPVLTLPGVVLEVEPAGRSPRGRAARERRPSPDADT